MIGSELAPYTAYILQRAREELDVSTHPGRFAMAAARCYVAIFGVPEVVAHVRIQAATKAIPRDARKVIDIGCGPGMLIGRIARLPWRPSVTGIELDSQAAQIATAAHPDTTIVQGDFVGAALPEDAFDAAALVDVLEHVPDEALVPFLQAARRILKPGGTLVMHVPATAQRRHFRHFDAWEHHDHEREGFNESDIRGLLTTAGFGSISVSGTFGYWGSLAWELNMRVAGGSLQAFVFPFALALATLDRFFHSKRYNGWLAVASKPIN